MSQLQIVPFDVGSGSATAVWHAAANREEWLRAKAGLPFVTQCGLRKSSRTGPKKAHQLAPMERCVVCCEGDA